MAAPRWPIVVGIAALGGGLALCVSRGDAPPPPRPPTAPVDPQGSAIGTPSGTGRAAVMAPAGPALATGSGHPFGGDLEPSVEGPAAPVAPAIAVVAPPSSQQLAFSAQTRDVAWAGKTESEIKRRLGRLEGAQLDAAECRHDQCELTIGGTQDGVAAALGVLESKRGLRDLASSVVLTAPEQRDGRLIIRAYAQFERPQADDAPAP